MTEILASGAMMAVTVTISASSQAPSFQKAAGRDSMVVARRCPMMSTVRKGAVTATEYSTRAVALSAVARASALVRVRRNVASHRKQLACP